MKRKAAILFGVLTVLLICFIWGQSMLPREVSAGESSSIMRWLKPLLDPQGRLDDELFHHYLRKAAHFTEYAALGFCLCGWYMNLEWKRTNRRIPVVVVLSVLIAAVDETIQLFSDSRGPHVRDVALDAVGAVFGLCVFLLLMKWINSRASK